MDLAGNVGVELDIQLEFAVGFDGLGDGGLALVHGDAVILFQRLGHVLGGDCTVQSAVGTALANELENDGGELCGKILRLFLPSFIALASAGMASFLGSRKFLAYPSDTSTI